MQVPMNLVEYKTLTFLSEAERAVSEETIPPGEANS